MGFLRSQKSYSIVIIVFCLLNIITTTGTECKEYPFYPTDDLTISQKWEYVGYGLAGGFALSLLIYVCFCSCTLFDDWLEKKIRRRREQRAATAATRSVPNQTGIANPHHGTRQIPQQTSMPPQTHIPIHQSSVPRQPRSILRQPSLAPRQPSGSKTSAPREVRINLDLEAKMS